MQDFSAIDLFDPRGRANRKGLAIIAAVLAGGQLGIYGTSLATGLGLNDPPLTVFHSLFLWLGVVAVAKRLHDLNFSAWRLAGAAAAMLAWCFVLAAGFAFTWGEDAMVPGRMGYALAALGSLAPLVLATIWIHCAKGGRGPNRFGPAPGVFGFSHPRLGHALAP